MNCTAINGRPPQGSRSCVRLAYRPGLRQVAVPLIEHGVCGGSLSPRDGDRRNAADHEPARLVVVDEIGPCDPAPCYLQDRRNVRVEVDSAARAIDRRWWEGNGADEGETRASEDTRGSEETRAWYQ